MEKNNLLSDIVKLEMISSNLNTNYNSLDYSKKLDVLAFSSGNVVHIYKPNGLDSNINNENNTKYIPSSILTLKGHDVGSRINTHKWLGDLPIIISCGSDGKIIVFESTNDLLNPDDWKISFVQKVDDESFNTMDVLYINNDEIYVALFSSSQNIFLYKFKYHTKDKFSSELLIKSKLKSIIVTISLSVLDEENLLIINGGYYKTLSINTFNRKNNQSNSLDCKLNLQGHIDTIRCINVNDKLNPKYIASSSQDTYVRLWSLNRLNEQDVISYKSRKKDNLTVFDEYKSQTSFVFSVSENVYYHILLESVLSDHEDAVSSVCFLEEENKMYILTSSFDFNVGLWELKNGIWDKNFTLGEMSGNKHSFFQAIFLGNKDNIIAYSYTGAMYQWKKVNNAFESVPVVHGHFKPVTDISWDNTGNILLSCSQDQTSRIYCLIKSIDYWTEISRPQIHGYDINSVAFLNNNNEIDKNYNLINKFICASEEKIIRMFEPSFNTLKYINCLSELEFNFSKTKSNDFFEKSYVEGTKHALNLTTKQVVVEDEEFDDKFDITKFDPTSMLTNQNQELSNSKNYQISPDEDFLTNHTLWPETNKLYGHSYEVITVEASHKGDIFASSGSARNEKYAQIFIWSISSNNVLQKLDGHILTVVQIRFSEDDQMILSVSRGKIFN